MRSRPLPVTVAAILLVLLSLEDLPFPWLLLFPGVEQPPAFIIYSGIVLTIVGFVAAVGLWMLKKWSYWATIVICVLNFLLGAVKGNPEPVKKLFSHQQDVTLANPQGPAVRGWDRLLRL